MWALDSLTESADQDIFFLPATFLTRKTLPVWMKTEPEMFWKHVKVCFKSKQLVRNWGQNCLWGYQCIIQIGRDFWWVIQTFSFNCDRTELIILKPLLRQRELTADSLECLQHRGMHSIPLSGSFNAQAFLTSLYVTYYWTWKSPTEVCGH